MYIIPKNYYRRLHHCRPRFKDDVDGVLLFVSCEIAKLHKDEHKLFAKELNKVIKLYPGNARLTDKTINNWRTEISALFGLIEYQDTISVPGRMSLMLAEKQDLISFFRYFLYYFQYPGGHLKPHETLELLRECVNFKPSKYLLNVLLVGARIVGSEKTFGISKSEATHCIFNDLRVTRDNRSAEETVSLILENRRKNVMYDSAGDTIRYSGDILDYMVLADLLNEKPNSKFYLKTVNMEVIHAFANSTSTFEPYEKLRGKNNLKISDVHSTHQEWFRYVNNSLYSKIFETNILDLIKGQHDYDQVNRDVKNKSYIDEVLSRIALIAEGESVTTKDIGDVGEFITIEHETNRLTALGREDILHHIKKIPESLAMGFDISSYEGVGPLRRNIEVKTTVSRRKLILSSFHMTPSEWTAAETYKDRYFIYRLIINANEIDLFIIQDPVGKYKSNIITMVPRDGADIRYDQTAGNWEVILI
jgi:hypothetical protein